MNKGPTIIYFNRNKKPGQHMVCQVGGCHTESPTYVHRNKMFQRGTILEIVICVVIVTLE